MHSCVSCGFSWPSLAGREAFIRLVQFSEYTTIPGCIKMYYSLKPCSIRPRRRRHNSPEVTKAASPGRGTSGEVAAQPLFLMAQHQAAVVTAAARSAPMPKPRS